MSKDAEAALKDIARPADAEARTDTLADDTAAKVDAAVNPDAAVKWVWRGGPPLPPPPPPPLPLPPPQPPPSSRRRFRC